MQSSLRQGEARSLFAWWSWRGTGVTDGGLGWGKGDCKRGTRKLLEMMAMTCADRSDPFIGVYVCQNIMN